mgnify:CR=1 FL=1
MAFSFLDPIYSIQGTGAVLTIAGVAVPVRAIDKTSGIETGEGEHVGTIRPAACLRVSELLAKGIKPRRLASGATLDLNGFVWDVASYKLKPSKEGENNGEVLLILSHKAAGASPVRTRNYAAVLYGPIYSVHGVPLTLALAGGEEFTFTGLDKTAGVNIGTVDVPTIRPAACLRTLDLAAKGIAPDDLPGASVVMNGFEWDVSTYHFRPSPDGEATGEILLVLAGVPVSIALHTFKLRIADDAGLLAALTRDVVLRAAFADEDGLLARLRKDRRLLAAFGDDDGLTARVRRELHMRAAFTMDEELEAQLRHPIRIKAAFDDNAPALFAKLTMAWHGKAAFADDAGLAALLTKTPARLVKAALADDAGLAVALHRFRERHIGAGFADDAGLAARVRRLNTYKLAAAIADDAGVNAAKVGKFKLRKVAAAIADDAGLTAGTLSHVAGNQPGTATLSGTAANGNTMTCTFNNDDPQGAATGITYQWFRDSGTSISGATSSTYTLTSSDTGHTVKCRVNYTDGKGNAESIFTADSATVGRSALTLNFLVRPAQQNNLPPNLNWTFTGVSFGTANTNRWILVSVFWHNATQRNLTGVTIGGVAASIVALTTIPNGSADWGRCAWVLAKVPTGTSGNIVVTFDGTFTQAVLNGVGLDVYNVIGDLNTMPFDYYQDETTANPSYTFTVPGGGFAVVNGTTGAVSPTITGDFTVDDNFNQYAASKKGLAAHYIPGSGGGLANWSGTNWSTGVPKTSKIGLVYVGN